MLLYDGEEVVHTIISYTFGRMFEKFCGNCHAYMHQYNQCYEHYQSVSSANICKHDSYHATFYHNQYFPSYQCKYCKHYLLPLPFYKRYNSGEIRFSQQRFCKIFIIPTKRDNNFTFFLYNVYFPYKLVIFLFKFQFSPFLFWESYSLKTVCLFFFLKAFVAVPCSYTVRYC